MASNRTTHEALLMALRARYDFASSRIMLDEMLKHAELPALRHYSPEQTSRLAWALNELANDAKEAVYELLELAGCAATSEIIEDPGDKRERLSWN